MKNKLLLLGVLILMAGIVLTGCETTNTSSYARVSYDNYGKFGEVALPVKDFEGVGLVFSEVSLQTQETKDKSTIKGDVFLYQELLKEAQKLGAHAIINVTIDRKVETQTTTTTTTGSNFTPSTDTTKIETWYGSALAIKYTTAIIPAAGSGSVSMSGSGSGSASFSRPSEFQSAGTASTSETQNAPAAPAKKKIWPWVLLGVVGVGAVVAGVAMSSGSNSNSY